MVTVASDFLIMLNGKWSSQKFQDEQINEKFGVAFSDGDICIFCHFHVSAATGKQNGGRNNDKSASLTSEICYCF
jgi:hypothetical protein